LSDTSHIEVNSWQDGMKINKLLLAIFAACTSLFVALLAPTIALLLCSYLLYACSSNSINRSNTCQTNN
jgi:hypothetical protein